MDTHLTTLIIIGIAAMLLLALGVILFVVLYQRRVIKHQVELERINLQKQQELLQASIQSEEEERARIASELHDDIGATLSSVRLFLHNAATGADNEHLEQSKKLLDDSIKKLRDISHKLQPATLFHLGLEQSILATADVINRSGSMKIKFTSTNTLPRFNGQVELSVYRILQELLNNIMKHANATKVDIETVLSDKRLTLSLTHNGTGLTEDSYHELIYKKGAIGLKNIENRRKSIQAAISFYTDNDEYGILLTVPVEV
ncbi:MAG: histidine kinase [Flavipsychrobacter sp.]